MSLSAPSATIPGTVTGSNTMATTRRSGEGHVEENGKLVRKVANAEVRL